MLDLILAQTTPPDPQLSGTWVLKLVAGIFSGLGLLGATWYAAFKKGEAKAATTRTIIDPPIPEVTTREALRFAESKTLDEHKSATDDKFKSIAEDIDQIHTRLNAAFKVLNTLEGSVGGIKDNVGLLLDRAMGLPPGTTVTRQRKPN